MIAEERRRIIGLALEAGFTAAAEFETKDLNFRREVRDMCAANRCGCYGTCWNCPPGCGTLEDSREKARAYEHGLVLQTTAQLEDDYDIESMEQAQVDNKASLKALSARLREEGVRFLPMGVGKCELCETCTYPEEPCRHPDLASPSMEAYGLVVSDVCESAGIPYYYGPRTLTFVSCILI